MNTTKIYPIKLLKSKQCLHHAHNYTALLYNKQKKKEQETRTIPENKIDQGLYCRFTLFDAMYVITLFQSNFYPYLARFN